MTEYNLYLVTYVNDTAEERRIRSITKSTVENTKEMQQDKKWNKSWTRSTVRRLTGDILTVVDATVYDPEGAARNDALDGELGRVDLPLFPLPLRRG